MAKEESGQKGSEVKRKLRIEEQKRMRKKRKRKARVSNF